MFASASFRFLLCGALLGGAATSDVQASTPIQGEAVRIRQIRIQPSQWENRIIVLEGMVERLTTGSNGASRDAATFFHLRDAYGDIVRVRTTAGVPDQRVLYRLRGTVSIDIRGIIYVTEEARSAVPLSTVQGFQPNSYQERVVEGLTVTGIDLPAAGEDKSATTTVDSAKVAVLQTDVMSAKPSAAGTGLALWLLAGLAIGAVVTMVGQRVGRGSVGPLPKAQHNSPSLAAPDAYPQGAGHAASRQPAGATTPEYFDPFVQAPQASSPVHSGAAQHPHSATVRVLPGWMELDGPTPRPIRFFATANGAHRSEITFGRDPGDPYAHVQLREQTVSRSQAKLTIIDGQYALENLSATNPTVINNEPLITGRKPLRDGDLIQMGEVVLRFRNRNAVSC
jgi:hypothetical protein